MVGSMPHSGAIAWYCERRGSGPAIVLIPSGEGDCHSFGRVANDLGVDFDVLTFDIPGYSQSSRPPQLDLVPTDEMAGQIAALVSSLGIDRATFYGCSSGGAYALALAANFPELVERAVIHEVAVPLTDLPPEEAAVFAGLFSRDDEVVVKTCRHLFRNFMNENQEAWDALGEDYHRRLDRNYLTWARHISPRFFRQFTREDLQRRPVTWTVGALTKGSVVEGNRRLAQVGGIAVTTLPCSHFPQVSIPELLAGHIRDAAKLHRPRSATNTPKPEPAALVRRITSTLRRVRLRTSTASGQRLAMTYGCGKRSGSA